MGNLHKAETLLVRDLNESIGTLTDGQSSTFKAEYGCSGIVILNIASVATNVIYNIEGSLNNVDFISLIDGIMNGQWTSPLGHIKITFVSESGSGANITGHATSC